MEHDYSEATGWVPDATGSVADANGWGGWEIGSSLIKNVSQMYFDYRMATQPAAVRWTASGTGAQYGVGANGEVYTRGVPGSVPVNAASVVNQMLPLALLAALGVVVYRMAK